MFLNQTYMCIMHLVLWIYQFLRVVALGKPRPNYQVLQLWNYEMETKVLQIILRNVRSLGFEARWNCSILCDYSWVEVIFSTVIGQHNLKWDISSLWKEGGNLNF